MLATAQHKKACLVALVAIMAALGSGASPTSQQPKSDASPLGAHDASHRDVADGSHPPADAHHDAPDVAPSDLCNGHQELCWRAYNAVTFPGTHGSYADTQEGFEAPDQTYPVARQLSEGIRVLHFEVHIYMGGVYVCHSLCAIGSRLLSDDMSAVSAFVTTHPTEVVTLLLERSDDMITADNIGDAMKGAGLEPYMRVQAVGASWPTLGEMIAEKQRVVALLDNPTGSSYTWLLPRWNLTWETPWDNVTAADFGQCNADRGTMGDGVYVVDTYLEALTIETPQNAELVNYDPFLVSRFLYCKQQTSTLPNFAMVNFYDVSDIFTVVDVLNGFAPTPPGVNLSAFPPSSFTDAGVVDAAGGDAGRDATDGTTDAGPPGDGASDAPG